MDPMDIDIPDPLQQYYGNNSFNHPPTVPPAAAQTLPQQPDIYQPLPSYPPQVIRLISISLPLPRVSSFILTTRLEVHPLDSAPPYNAISYVWGSSSSPASIADPNSFPVIICNDTIFPVTPNLHWALRRAAVTSAELTSFSDLSTATNTNTVSGPNHSNLQKKIYLWADAICINQACLFERSSQVSFMSQIYARAQRVLVCMGNLPPGSPPTSNYALANLVNTLGPYIQREAQGGPATTAVRSPHINIAADILKEIPSLAWKALGEIMNRPWFRRVWVMQEVGMASQERQPIVLYDPLPLPLLTGTGERGRAEFGYRDLMAVVKWARGQKELVLRYGISSLKIHVEWAGSWAADCDRDRDRQTLGVAGKGDQGDGRSNLTFYDLIDHASLLSCQDPRDRIYAFLGYPLAPKRADGTPRIKPDYTKDVNELYLEMARVCLQEIVGLRALVTVEHTAQSLRDGFPSWMTRWHIADIWNSISWLPEHVFSAGGIDEPGYRPAIQGGNLMLEGAVVDHLWRCCPVYTNLPESSVSVLLSTARGERPAGIGEFLSFLTSRSVPSAYGDDLNSRLAAFAMTMCAATATAGSINEPRAGQGGIDISGTARWHLLGLSRLLAIDTRSWRDFDSSTPEAITGMAFWRKLSGACQGRSFAITERGMYCLVPEVAKEGDQICMVRRLDVPVVMRVEWIRRALLGEAYVLGLMHGEAMRMVQRGELVGEVFVVS
ncbi:Heterokaryon incompatibility protein (HET) domain containing protein [Naviculisporaceae sp. PSN 640]